MNLKQILNLVWNIIIITFLVFMLGFNEQELEEYYERKDKL